MTTSIDPRKDVGWDTLVAFPPAGIQQEIDKHQQELGFSWDDVKGFATALSAGEPIDARVVAVSGTDKSLPTTASAARKAVGITDSDVPAIHISTATVLNGELPSNRSVVLIAPLINDPKLKPKSGVIIDAGKATLVYSITYTVLP